MLLMWRQLIAPFPGDSAGKLTWQWKMDPLKMCFLLKMGIFHCYVSLPEGIRMSTSLGSTSLFRDALCIDPNSTLPNSTTCLSSIGNPAGFAVTAGFRDNTCSWKSPKNIPRIDARRSHLWTKSQPDSESRCELWSNVLQAHWDFCNSNSKSGCVMHWSWVSHTPLNEFCFKTS